MRRAKIIGTLGPASSDVEVMTNMIRAGLDVVRMNMSHGTYEEHGARVKKIREAATLAGKEVAILLDLQGPKIRVDKLKENLILKKDETWVIGPSDVMGDYPEYEECFIPTVYKDLVKDAGNGGRILFDDGLIEAKSLEKDRDVLKIRVVVGGELKSNKGINLPDSEVSAASFTEKDSNDLEFGLTQGIDYVAMSFVRTEKDVQVVKDFLKERNFDLPIVSKIERPEAVRNIKKIARLSDVIMVARGDMGVELGNQKVPTAQKMIITYCNDIGTPVITATQMLETMITNSTPTRAEASDVANAVWDGTDAVMLSGETAVGVNPVRVIKMMSAIVEEAERMPKPRPSLRSVDLSSIQAAIQVSASLVAEKTDAKWIIGFSKTGNSCRNMVRFRPKPPVLGVANSIETVRKMCLFWGVVPYFYDSESKKAKGELKDDVPEHDVIEYLRQKDGSLEKGDRVVLTYGQGKIFSPNTSNSIRVNIVE